MVPMSIGENTELTIVEHCMLEMHRACGLNNPAKYVKLDWNPSRPSYPLTSCRTDGGKKSALRQSQKCILTTGRTTRGKNAICLFQLYTNNGALAP